MPTPLDRALSSKNAVLAFTGIVTAAAAWSIWGTDMFPKEEDPTGDPATWSREELRRWLAAVSTLEALLFFKLSLVEINHIIYREISIHKAKILKSSCWRGSKQIYEYQENHEDLEVMRLLWESG
ncbi:hypothetical protein NHQ30_002761 [Ciborinia camelliae]|nr:hypothetical protein NHQ30_002761 [Ciborinia camelliae]